MVSSGVLSSVAPVRGLRAGRAPPRRYAPASGRRSGRGRRPGRIRRSRSIPITSPSLPTYFHQPPGAAGLDGDPRRVRAQHRLRYAASWRSNTRRATASTPPRAWTPSPASRSRGGDGERHFGAGGDQHDIAAHRRRVPTGHSRRAPPGCPALRRRPAAAGSGATAAGWSGRCAARRAARQATAVSSASQGRQTSMFGIRRSDGQRARSAGGSGRPRPGRCCHG